ncbi:hypothetical protein ANCCEY_05633 [Ancylostoma ceylanicum]|uniref:Uncharacterized protein n=1 Tax=Ancylostoma ceylanicum TaxID=53326 RepID=A0A0D6M5Y2_9BILA|nr:hypothetical protein ANCCEY_05633 [Ancylostoma ceylanicum]
MLANETFNEMNAFTLSQSHPIHAASEETRCTLMMVLDREGLLCTYQSVEMGSMYKVCDLSLILAIAGLLFVIIDAELTALSPTTHITKAHNVSLFLRSLAVLTTVCLMCCLINYHAIEWKVLRSLRWR